MVDFLSLPRRIRADRRGVTALEYALVGGAMAAVLVAAFTVLAGYLQTALTAAASLIPGA